MSIETVRDGIESAISALRKISHGRKLLPISQYAVKKLDGALAALSTIDYEAIRRGCAETAKVYIQSLGDQSRLSEILSKGVYNAILGAEPEKDRLSCGKQCPNDCPQDRDMARLTQLAMYPPALRPVKETIDFYDVPDGEECVLKTRFNPVQNDTLLAGPTPEDGILHLTLVGRSGALYVYDWEKGWEKE